MKTLRLNFVLLVIVLICAAQFVVAHPLGNFTINHFVRISPSQSDVKLHYVVDMAEIPAFQVLQQLDKSKFGGSIDVALDSYLEGVIEGYAAGLQLRINNQLVPLRVEKKKILLQEGTGGLSTIRIECDFAGRLPNRGADPIQRFHFEDFNHSERIGWHEIVVSPSTGTTVFDTTAFGSAVTDELKSYPDDMLASPLNERRTDFSSTSGSLPPGASALRTRTGHQFSSSPDHFARLISVPVLTPLVALLGLLIAAGLGAFHALSPGHGKTVVGAYLVGTRGTAKHALFLGLTVTVTHTVGVFALGLVTLLASQYLLPEQIFPILSFLSGAIVLVMGLTLFFKRLGRAMSSVKSSGHDQLHSHEGHPQPHSHDGSLVHTHDGSTHSHLPPGADGGAVTWRSLLALGISGGLLPCPSALVVLLSAIALHRVAYGLLLVVAFSVGLATTLTLVGLLFVFASRFLKRETGDRGVFVWLPVLSALVIAGLGTGICYEALSHAGISLANVFGSGGTPPLSSVGVYAVLSLGLVFGLKHATEVDHVVAVSTIVSEHQKLSRAALVGALWGLGHTASLVIVGIVVVALRVAVPELVSSWLEFIVALMIIGLGVTAVARALHRRSSLEFTQHSHEEGNHQHTHFHPGATALSQLGIKPLVVGAMHGLAGSGALTVLVLTQIPSAMLGLVYLGVFGVGSIIGMLLMSFLVGLPFVVTARRLGGLHYGLQAMAGVFSVGFGVWYAYQTGIASGLFRATM
jgi:nickel/cobalt exporter